MEMEYFVPPAEAEEWYRYWIAERLAWYTRYGDPRAQACVCARTRPTSCRTTRAATSDIEYLYPIGWSELEGDRESAATTT